MTKNELGSFISWLIVKRKVKNRQDFATKTDINRGHLYKNTIGYGEITDRMMGKILAVFEKEYELFAPQYEIEEDEPLMVNEDECTGYECDKCKKKIALLHKRIAELEELLELYRANNRQQKESKRAV